MGFPARVPLSSHLQSKSLCYHRDFRAFGLSGKMWNS
jgi:hypothetical protein